MADLADYERRGDLNAPFGLTKKHERAQTEAARLRESTRCDVPRLTWEAYMAGEPCPGCGLPYRDEEPREFKGTMHFTETTSARAMTLRKPASRKPTATVTPGDTESPDH